jgi:hypothetical protein
MTLKKGVGSDPDPDPHQNGKFVIIRNDKNSSSRMCKVTARKRKSQVKNLPKLILVRNPRNLFALSQAAGDLAVNKTRTKRLKKTKNLGYSVNMS